MWKDAWTVDPNTLAVTVASFQWRCTEVIVSYYLSAKQDYRFINVALLFFYEMLLCIIWNSLEAMGIRRHSLNRSIRISEYPTGSYETSKLFETLQTRGNPSVEGREEWRSDLIHPFSSEVCNCDISVLHFPPSPLPHSLFCSWWPIIQWPAKVRERLWAHWVFNCGRLDCYI